MNFWQKTVSRYTGSGGGIVSYDSDSIAFFAVNTGLTIPQKNAVNDLVVGLKGAGLWNRMRAVYPFIGGTSTAHRWNLVDPRDSDLAKRLVFVGGVTHGSNGIKPNGTTGYAKTFFDPHEECPQYSFHGSYYSRENNAPGSGDFFPFGGKGVGPAIQLDFYNTNGIYGDVGSINFTGSPTALTITSQTTFNGLFTLTCLYDNFLKIYRGSTQLGSQTTSRYGYFQNNDPNTDVGKLYLGAFNNNETAAYFSSYECGFASFGWGLNDSQVSAFNSIVNNYLTALNRL